MSDPEPTWQPISALPMITNLIADMLHDAQEHYTTLKEAEDKPHVLDDYTVNRVIKVYTDQLEDCSLFEEQLARWKTLELTPEQRDRIAIVDAQVLQLRTVGTKILVLAEQLKEGTIDSILRKSDSELALEILSGKQKLPS